VSVYYLLSQKLMIVNTSDNIEYRRQWDPPLAKIENLAKLDGEWCVVHIQFHSPVAIVSARDFVFARNIIYEGNSCFLPCVSVKHPACPPIKHIVRAKCVLASWYLEEVQSNNTTNLKVVYLTQTDFK
jgi:hypothetical protein